MNHLERACEGLDAAVFSSDMMYDPEQYAMFKEYLSRWNRAVEEHDKAETTAATLPAAAQPEQEPTAWLCGRSNGDTFALTVKQLRELGYGNISMPPFKKLAPLFTALAQQGMAHDRMMDDGLTIGSAWSRGGERIEPTSVYKSMEEDT